MYIEKLKFSLWADFIERDYLDGEFKKLVSNGIINGATSNPAIFKNAISTSGAYKEQLATLEFLTPKAKYEAIAIFDIQKAADILKPLYDKGDDGYVSIEVDPFFCDDAQASIEEGKRLFSEINRENVMIKVPATSAGYIAIEELIAEGIPVNATLVFKKEQAISCARAIERGLQKTKKRVYSVISIFVSRVDRAIDVKLKEAGVEVALSGIYNSADIYVSIQEMNIDGCRALFASTGVKDNLLEESYYVDELIGYNCVNTAPIDTIKAFDNNGIKKQTLPIDANIIKEHFKRVKAAGIDIDKVLDSQIEDGLMAFKEAFKNIQESL